MLLRKTFLVSTNQLPKILHSRYQACSMWTTFFEERKIRESPRNILFNDFKGLFSTEYTKALLSSFPLNFSLAPLPVHSPSPVQRDLEKALGDSQLVRGR